MAAYRIDPYGALPWQVCEVYQPGSSPNGRRCGFPRGSTNVRIWNDGDLAEIRLDSSLIQSRCFRGECEIFPRAKWFLRRYAKHIPRLGRTLLCRRYQGILQECQRPAFPCREELRGLLAGGIAIDNEHRIAGIKDRVCIHILKYELDMVGILSEILNNYVRWLSCTEAGARE